MKIYLIAILASLALWASPTEGQESPVIIDVPVVEVPVQVIHEKDVNEEVIEVADEENLDVKRMFQDLFHYNYDDEKKIDERDGKQLLPEDEEEDVDFDTRQSVNDPEVVSKYNGFVDAFLSRLGDAMRLNHDPMRLVIRQSGKIDAEGDQKFQNNKKFQGLKRSDLKKGGKKGKIHPKDVSVADEGDVPVNEEDSERNKREIPSENEENLEDYEYYDDEGIDDYEEGMEGMEGMEGRALDTEADLVYDDEYNDEDYEEYEDDEQALQETREGKSITVLENPEGKSNDDYDSELVEGRKRGARQRRRRRKGGRGRRRRKCGKFCQRRRRRLRRRKFRNRRRGKRSTGNQTPTAVISGISRIKRFGNVRIFDRENSQDIVSEFGLGPVVLKAQKSYGTGSQRDIREAQAMAPLVMGELIINVNRRGEARIKRMKLNRPTGVQVTGTLRRKLGLKSDKAMESFVRRTRPVVSRTMKQAATRIFRVAQNSSNNNNGFNL